MDLCPKRPAPLCLCLSFCLPLSLEKIPAFKIPAEATGEHKTTMLDRCLLSSMYCPLCLCISVYSCRTDEFSFLVINPTARPDSWVAALLESEYHSLEKNEPTRNMGEHHRYFKGRDLEFRKEVMVGKIMRESSFC